jgi:uncharacterized hydrophobic protein (TIGR00271 family)
MLVAPLMTPILGTAAAIVQGWGRRIAESLAIVLAGAAVAITVGFVIAFLEPRLTSGAPLPGELLARTKPNVTDLAIALAAGAAGAFVTVRSEASSALPGVGIAVALVPPLATVGMCIALSETHLAAGALLLFSTNLVAIILAGGIIFVMAGFAAYRGQTDERRTRIAALILFGAVILFSLPLGSHGLQQLQSGRMQADVAQAVRTWAPDLELQSIELDRDQDRIIAEIMLTGISEPPPAAGIAEILAEDFGRPVAVELVFVPVDVAESDPP